LAICGSLLPQQEESLFAESVTARYAQTLVAAGVGEAIAAQLYLSNYFSSRPPPTIGNNNFRCCASASRRSFGHALRQLVLGSKFFKDFK
jgi:hypothetical protein